ncbi:MAG: hypothetical protein AAGH49_10945 [Pseudomonadota bacterium]
MLAYLIRVIRALTSALWLIAALALGFDAMAQPCNLNAQVETAMSHEMMSDMPCHDHMDMTDRAPNDQPQHDMQACCCAALLGNGVTTTAPAVSQPTPGLSLWASPLPVLATSISLDDEPPPPRI